MFKKFHYIVLAVAVFMLSAVPAFAASGREMFQSSMNAVLNLQWEIYILSAVIFVLVGGILLYVIFAFRAGRNAKPKAFTGNTRLEIFWTIIPVIIVTYLAVYSANVVGMIRTVPSNHMTMNITGHQWYWEYKYPDGTDVNATGTSVELPANTNVLVRLHSGDVVHDFWLFRPGGAAGTRDANAVKQDMLPGRTTQAWFNTGKAGTVFEVKCAEYCGAGHYAMHNQIKIVSQSDYQAWLQKQKSNQ